MRRRRALLAAVGAVAAAAAWRRRGARHVVDLHYADGSVLELEEGTEAADDLLALVRRTLRQAEPA